MQKTQFPIVQENKMPAPRSVLQVRSKWLGPRRALGVTWIREIRLSTRLTRVFWGAVGWACRRETWAIGDVFVGLAMLHAGLSRHALLQDLTDMRALLCNVCCFVQIVKREDVFTG
ncbi:hypothetical protein HBI56_027990 [Parastagonospora nodorum]|uniref:Uncharacterized protein n=1 Tax=Phaeosphaeria nodorum (strain SN15 / ATCC MYA-4574 / FGSC 10173) TaxID=321614 RepID=A0A7U2EXP2_PHANO|nr:hypothetical protein HBH56_015660 [Parastagonospora nodorum]QRC95036.1 hypothetical protein JI435_406790 [Parastagonospora nodorum SN15]KAH3936892.1 hypothetical protein HBH54_018780 [Parastagonospora nodorum]KAH3953964.1 hypothetical protein HBH53_031190 [Parastagonospora nodorum]KAH3969233.1 hypothetical protein HBH51_123350 [Parastagonospora nodorum]